MYKKYKLKGLDSVEDIKSLEEYISLYQGVIHCSINKHILFIDTKTKISEQDLNKYINQYNNKVSILLKTDSHEHKEYYSCGHDHTHHSECNCGHYHEHKEDQRSLNQSHKFIITGLDCANCAMKVEKAINNLDYVEEAVLNFTTLTLYVKSDEKDLMNKLQSFVDKIESGVVISQDNDIVLKPQLFNLKEHKNIIIGIVLLIISLCLSHKIISFIFVLSAYLIIGYPVLSKAYRNILKGQIFDENFLMCIATIGALIIGEYFEAVAVMLFYSIGEIIQSYAVNKTRTSITQLMDIKSDYANVLENGKIVVKDPADVNCGEVIVVKVGEKIPVDGIVVKGHSSLDTSSLTGESLPKDIGYNDEVLAGMINLTEVIYIRVIRPFKDSAVAKIIDLMENAASKKAPLERFITRFARIYTPIVCIMALLLVLIPMLVFEDASFHTWLYRSLTFLVVSCPCALVVSIPLGLYAGLGKASQLGALIKGGNYLEYLKNIDTVVFDKTGTLTKGTFSVKNIQGDHQLLEIAAYCESMSNHPISKSITSYYNQSIDYNRLSDYKEIAGKGIQCRFDGIMYYLGNKTYMNQLGISIKQTDIIGTAVYISKDNQYLGCIIVDDEIKESAIKGLKHLKEAGITHTVMLTGDKHNVALKIAEKLNIDTVYSELLPQDKVLKVEELLKEHKVIFAGDGINDAPVLSRAHIGIAMGGVGSDAAIEAADIVLMNDNIDIIGDIIQLSKRTNRILKQNVIFTLFIKISVLILTMFGYSNMWMGVFADVGVALIAIMNSMRILK